MGSLSEGFWTSTNRSSSKLTGIAEVGMQLPACTDGTDMCSMIISAREIVLMRCLTGSCPHDH